MIIQERDGELLVFRQTDHALLSGAFAAAWGNETVPVPHRRESTVVAAFRHDDGWADWELRPTLDDEGRAVDFIHIPVREHVELYKRGIDLVEDEDPYAGLLASLHGERLYTRPFFPGMEPRIEKLEGEALDLARGYVEGERRRQERLSLQVEGECSARDIEEGWRLLQVWDRLSLLVCMRPLEEGTEQEMPPVSTPDGDVQIMARGIGDGRLALEPYPFNAPEVAFNVAGARTSRTRWPDQRLFREELRGAERFVLDFVCASSG
jgi:hypothetical protein